MDTKKNNIVSNEKSKFITMLCAVAISFAITAIIFIGYAILLTYSSVGEQHLTLVITSTSIISIVVAGFDMAKSCENKGWLWGIFTGLIYALILTIIGIFVANKAILNSQTLMLFLLAAASGGVGGIIGINFKK